jgi:hypothetical protein
MATIFTMSTMFWGRPAVVLLRMSFPEPMTEI